MLCLHDDWRLANVSPIYKRAGSRCQTDNFRPVSLTSVVSKIMESLIRNELYNYLNVNGLLTRAQHGFRPGLSTVTQLLKTITDFAKSLKNEQNIDFVYLDYSKAFDTI